MIENAGLKSHIGQFRNFRQPTPNKMEELSNQKMIPLTNYSLIMQHDPGLSRLYQELQKETSIIAELAVGKERKRLAHEVHDTMGHTLTLIVLSINNCLKKCNEDDVLIKEKLIQTLKIAQDGLTELRRTMQAWQPDFSKKQIIDFIGNIINNARLSGIKVELSICGEEYLNEKGLGSSLFFIYETIRKICVEAITNSVRHGFAKRIDIIFHINPDRLLLFIIDDGQGCPSIKKGFGLTGMEERIQNLNGKITYGSDGERGFTIRVEIPLAHQ